MPMLYVECVWRVMHLECKLLDDHFHTITTTAPSCLPPPPPHAYNVSMEVQCTMYTASSQTSWSFQHTQENRESLGSNFMWQTFHDIMNERQATTVDFKLIHQLQFYHTQLFEVFKALTALSWKLWHHIFRPCRTGALENIASPLSIITTSNPSYLRVMFVTQNWIPGSPSFLCMLKRSGSQGTRVQRTHNVWMMLTCTYTVAG